MISIVGVDSRKNTGDMACLPSLYFPELADTEFLLVGEESYDPGGLLIVGGGGLFRAGHAEEALRTTVLSHQGPRVLWGPGLNNDGAEATDRYPAWIHRCHLVGVRDVLDPLDWVPCVSCLAPSLALDYPVRHPVVVYHGPGVGERISGADEFPQAGCEMGLSMAEAVEFLGSGEVVVTSSYHGWYWAALLGRRVVLIPGRRCSKFYRLPIAVRTATQENWRHKIEGAMAFPDFASRCQRANREFFATVQRNFPAFFR